MIKIKQGYYCFEIKNYLIQEGAKYALYQIDKRNNEVVKKYWYQESIEFPLDLMGSSIENFRFRFYILDTFGNKIIDTYNTSESLFLDINPEDFIKLISKTCEKVFLIKTLHRVIEDESFFSYCIRVKHGSFKIQKNNLEIINNELKIILEESISIRSVNALKFLIYFLCKDALVADRDLILRKCDFLLTEQDFLFFKAVFYFRIGEKCEAKYYNKQLFKYKHLLKYHQQGAISYIDTLDIQIQDARTFTRNIKRLVDIQNLNQSSVILMSCDYGYFCAYAEKTIENASRVGNLLHFHLVIPHEEVLAHLDERVYKNKNIGISYEIFEAHNTNKTYYSISRYLILKDIIDLYQCNIIVCDIDIDLKENVDYLSSALGDQKIGLISNDGDLPWITYMAGFNFFGRKTVLSSFVSDLISIIELLFLSGRDLWTLDQVALLLAVESQEKTGDTELLADLKRELKMSIKQYPDRQEYRRVAQKSLETFENRNSS